MPKPINQLLLRPIKRLLNHPAIQQRATHVFQWLATGQRSQKILFRLFGKSTWYYLLLARSQRIQGDDHGAYRTLMLGQRCVADDYRIHIKLSELYRDNGHVRGAHTHLKIADALKTGYSTIRLLTFETDHGLLGEGSNTMAKILAFPSHLIQRHLPMLNRISIYYPKHHKHLEAAREELKHSLLAASYTTPDELSNAVDKAISNRWLRVAVVISQNRMSDLRPATQQLLKRLVKDLGAYETMLELAWKNEVADTPEAIFQGKPVSLTEIHTQSRQLVELFIPTPFFAEPEHEKPTYETIRLTFSQIIRYLYERNDVIIIPRYQLNWRDCVPRMKGNRIISYHTNAQADNYHLHIQETPLASCASFDHSGFAGFASIATDYSAITRFVADISREQLAQNQRDMYDQYVNSNISKYQQPSDNEPILGPYVFVALQIPTDVVSRLAWISGIDLLRGVVDHFRGTDMKVVVKRHPYCGSMGVQQCLDELESAGLIIRTNNSIHSLISSAHCVLTVNSGVGLEALMHGKTVIVSGKCDYSYAVKTVKNREELSVALAGDLSPDEERIRELLYFYAHRYAVRATDVDHIRRRLSEWLA